MIKTTWLKIAGALAITSLATVAIAADHRDSPSVVKDPSADINDVYSFVDGDKVALAMTVVPDAVEDSKFSDKIQYIFHTTSGTAFGEAKSSLDIVCTFDAAQMITCMAGAGAGMPVLDKVTGDASMDAGLVSENKMLNVYAGLRKDPFFFNLAGFKKVVEIVTGAAPNLQKDPAGCPDIGQQTSTLLVNQLKSNELGAAGEDGFANFNGLAIVIQVDKTLIASTGAIISVWGSTNTAAK